MRTDSEIQRDVDAELKWAPDVNETDIAAKVRGGVVTLTGYAASYQEKFRAEAVVKGVLDVAAVANDLAVRPPLGGMPTDPDIARDAVAALKWELPLAWDHIKTIVKEGHVALEGTVDWHYERELAESAVRRLRGVMGVRNSITLKKRVAVPELKHKIEAAFKRNAIIDAQKIVVEGHGSEVTLRGQVRSWAERDQAEATAWAAPGVVTVKNEITIRT